MFLLHVLQILQFQKGSLTPMKELRYTSGPHEILYLLAFFPDASEGFFASPRNCTVIVPFPPCAVQRGGEHAVPPPDAVELKPPLQITTIYSMLAQNGDSWSPTTPES